MAKSTIVVNSTKPLDTILLPPGLPKSLVTLPTIMLVTIPPPVNLYIGMSLGPVPCVPLILPPGTPVDLAPTAPGVLLLVWLAMTKCGGIGAAIAKLDESINNNKKIDDEPEVPESIKTQLRDAKKKIQDTAALFQANGGSFPDTTGRTAAINRRADALVRQALATARRINTPVTRVSDRARRPRRRPSGPIRSPQAVQDIIFDLEVVGEPELTSQLQAEVTRRIAEANRIFSNEEILQLAEVVLRELRLAQFGA